MQRSYFFLLLCEISCSERFPFYLNFIFHCKFPLGPSHTYSMCDSCTLISFVILWSNIVELLHRNNFGRPLSSSSLKWTQSTSFFIMWSFFCLDHVSYISSSFYSSCKIKMKIYSNAKAFISITVVAQDAYKRLKEFAATALASVFFFRYFFFRIIRSMQCSCIARDQFSSIQLNLYLSFCCCFEAKKKQVWISCRFPIAYASNICTDRTKCNPIIYAKIAYIDATRLHCVIWLACVVRQ